MATAVKKCDDVPVRYYDGDRKPLDFRVPGYQVGFEVSIRKSAWKDTGRPVWVIALINHEDTPIVCMSGSLERAKRVAVELYDKYLKNSGLSAFDALRKSRMQVGLTLDACGCYRSPAALVLPETENDKEESK